MSRMKNLAIDKRNEETFKEKLAGDFFDVDYGQSFGFPNRHWDDLADVAINEFLKMAKAHNYSWKLIFKELKRKP